ncbi:MAG TPA: cytochrome P450 [Solirubrobacteraceae bacterium]|nr:cytochrome P450 [Solirubrobacteraceae bacterium]
MPLTAPEPGSSNPVRKLAADLIAERRAGIFPPGEKSPSLHRTRRFAADPLSLLLESYERYGPVFTLRIFHANVVFMLGPEANHHITVSHAGNFRWREGHIGDLIPLIGDGLLTIDGEFHDRSRRIMLPAFHHERVAESIDVMASETDRALEAWRDGGRVDVYHWTRRLAMRIAMQALFGLDPEARPSSLTPADLFERALSFYSRDYFLQVMRGPKTPFAQMQRARDALDGLIYSEIARRRRTGERGQDILSLLLDAHDEHGHVLSDRHLRDEVMTLLFAGHDTTTSTVAFLFYELARHPEVAERLRAEQQRVTGGQAPTAGQLMAEMPELDMALEETLRLYPPAWIGPRQSVEPFEFAGVRVPGGAPVNYSSWVSHHLPHVFEDPERFWPERFCTERRRRLPKGAYVPFGAGSRICIGMRFGQLEVKLIAAMVLARFGLQLAPGYRLSIRQMPTIGPREGMPIVVTARSSTRPATISAVA